MTSNTHTLRIPCGERACVPAQVRSVVIELIPSLRVPVRPKYALRPLRRSAAKSGEGGDVDFLSVHRMLRDPKFISRTLDLAYPAASQHQQCLTAARAIGVHPETIRRWITGATAPSFQDFWPILLRAYQRQGDARAFTSLVSFMDMIAGSN